MTNKEADALAVLESYGGWVPLPARRRGGRRGYGEHDYSKLAARHYVRIAEVDVGHDTVHARITIPGEEALRRFERDKGVERGATFSR